MKTITIIFMVTSDCNANCSYCYVYSSRKNQENFPIKDIQKSLRNISKGFDSIKFCWHGGEPLLVGIDFYKSIVQTEKEIQEEQGTQFTNTLQTNGILLNQEWIDFFKTNSFQIGLSIDAPQKVFEIQRGNFFDKILSACDLLKKNKLPIGALCVVSKLNAYQAEEVFEFYKKIGISYFGLLPLKNTNLPFRPVLPTNSELFNFYKTIFDLWITKENSFSDIEPISSMIKLIMGNCNANCSFSSRCLKKLITINQEGSVIPCSSLTTSEFILGDIRDNSIVSILKNDKVKNLRKKRAKAIQKNCLGCEFISLCRGGCRADAFWESSYFGPYPFCEERKMLFLYIREKLKSLKIL